MTKDTKAVATTDAKIEKVIRKVPSGTQRKMGNAVSKAVGSLADDKAFNALKKDAKKGLKVARALVGKELINGKLSPLGHMATRQNGKLDIAILTMDIDKIDEWFKAIQKGDQAGRKTELTDNKGLVKRAKEHIHWIAGRSDSAVRGFTKTLDKIGKGKDAEAIMNALAPMASMVDEVVARGKF